VRINRVARRARLDEVLKRSRVASLPLGRLSWRLGIREFRSFVVEDATTKIVVSEGSIDVKQRDAERGRTTRLDPLSPRLRAWRLSRVALAPDPVLGVLSIIEIESGGE
jgi:hypothetical protein